MNTNHQNLAIVIPSLDPTQALVSYIHDLIAQGFAHIYIVNDGSQPHCAPIFQSLAAIEGCTLLTHPENLGKGMALKTAFHHIQQTFPRCGGIITADSDGQHAVKDVCQMADALAQYPGHLLLGGRSFSQGDIPIKSLLGNRLSSLVFLLLHGTWVQDTQTGLRGFDMSLLPLMLSIPGERFEYEMAVLTTCASKKIPLHFLPIDTIYINGNAGSHFRPMADSLRIGGVLFGNLCRFFLSSGLSWFIDIALCWGLLYYFAYFITSNLLRIGLSVALARTISLVLNYTLNRIYVFGATAHSRRCFGRYLLLAMANMVALTALIYLSYRWMGIDERLATILASAILFCINYPAQKIWVFSVQPGGAT